MLYCTEATPQDVAPSPSSDGLSARESVAPKAAGTAPLGNTAKSVDQIRADRAARERRAMAFQLQRTAAKLLPRERVGLCRWAVISKWEGVDVRLTSYEGGAVRASYAGLQTCGSVWLCPCCGRRISEKRRGELNELLAWAREQGLQPVMLTLTARHGIRDDLGEQLDAMKRAKQRLRQRREWRTIKPQIAGTVTATEVTHGKNGWHTHFHEIALIRADSEAEALRIVAPLARTWRACLVGVGLSGGRAAFQVQGAAAAGSYVGKWGAAEEITLGAAKSAKGRGRTPMQLLAAADEGDELAGRLWQVYALSFKGRRQLVWSPGLKATAGIDETSDQDAADDEGQDDAENIEPLLKIGHSDWVGRPGWHGARYRRARILDAAETDGAAAAAAVVADPGEDLRSVPDIELIEDVSGTCAPNSRIVKDDQKKEGAVGGKDRRSAQGPRQGDSPSSCPAGPRARAREKPPAG